MIHAQIFLDFTQSKGHVNDQLLITVPAVSHHFRVPQVISSLAIAQLGCNHQEDRELLAAKVRLA
jgi:hypothetical protein